MVRPATGNGARPRCIVQHPGGSAAYHTIYSTVVECRATPATALTLASDSHRLIAMARRWVAESEAATHDNDEAIGVAERALRPAVLAARHWKSLEAGSCNVDDGPRLGSGPPLRSIAVEAIASVRGDATVAWNAAGVVLAAVGVARAKLCCVGHCTRRVRQELQWRACWGGCAATWPSCSASASSPSTLAMITVGGPATFEAWVAKKKKKQV